MSLRVHAAAGREIMPLTSLFRKSHAADGESPLARYQARIAAGEFRADRAQLAALRHLSELRRMLLRDMRGARRGLLARWLRRHNRSRGIYLWGGVGTGKTALMDMFYHSLPGGMAKRIHYHRFMQSVHQAKREMRARQDPLALIAAQLAARRRALCLDEFAVTDITDAMILSGLLHALFARGVALVTTSNQHPDQLYRGGLQRARFLPAIELIKARTRVVRVDGGSDYRLNHLALDALYHVPHDAAAMRALRRHFTWLEGGDGGGGGGRVTLAARAVQAVALGRGTLWCGFDALCNTHRSKVDYIELSKRFHTLILSDIPALDADMEDAARRLIELVDELYDRGVNLIASAARAPQELYCGARLAQPFARTASRLREMGTREYLARPHLQ
ncbi:MAG: cell division protein ZapE [Gammaproteobacteria bacterium]